MPAAADVGVVAALGVEVGHLTDRLRNRRDYAGAAHKVVEGEAGGKLVAVVVGGVGRPNARRAAGVLIAGHRPRWVVSAGFAGALDPGLRRGDALLPDEILDPDGVRYAIDLALPTVPSADTAGPRLRTGRLVTVDHVVMTAAAKAALREATGAIAVDMETSAVAALCAERDTRFLAVRVISDDARTELPAEVAALLTRTGSYRVGAALRAVWNRPGAVKDFWSLHAASQVTADRLADLVVALLERLPA